jgi:DNA-binding response OmpR family regulator
MSSPERRIDDLVVVDASIDDYAALLSDRELQDLPVRHFSSGEEALQHFDPWLATLWMVNMRLPDMTGVGFLHLVRYRSRRCPVFLIGDAYLPDEEVAARAAGASAYLCKPVNASWLHLCRSAISRTALRAGAPHTLQ